jgi:hypothetical protein
MQVSPRKIRPIGLLGHTVFISGTSHKEIFATYSRKPEERQETAPQKGEFNLLIDASLMS